MRMSIVALSVSALLTLLAGGSQAGVIVVDPSGGSGQALLQQAIDSAADGDLIVLKAGDYDSLETPITIRGKGLTIVADTQFTQLVRGVVVSEVPAGRGVVLQHLFLGDASSGPVENFTSGLQADLSGGGDLRVQDCFVTGARGQFVNLADIPAYPAAVLTGAGGRATFVNCNLHGGDGHFHVLGPGGEHGWAQAGAPALVADGLSVALYQCTLKGGNGGDGSDAGSDPPPDGGAGLIVREGAFALVHGGTLTGGYEGANPAPGATSGDGARIEASGGQIWLRGAALAAGTVNIPGTPGQPLALLGGTSSSFTEPAQSFSDGQEPLYREGDPMLFFLVGAHPGDAVALLVSVQAGFVPLAARQGVLGLSPTLLLGPIALGVANANGLVSAPAVAPQLPASLASLLVYAQPVELSPGGAVLGPARTIVLLDAAIP